MFDYLRRLASTGASYTASSVISKLFAVALLPVYTRHLTRADYGAAEVLLATVVALSIVVPPRDHRGAAALLLPATSDDGSLARRGRSHARSRFLLHRRSPSARCSSPPFAGPLSEAAARPARHRADADRDRAGCGCSRNYELLMALFRLDERARAYFTASLANVLLTIALTVWLVVVEDEGARGLLLGQLRRLRAWSSPALLRGPPPPPGAGAVAASACGRCCASGFPTMPAELSLYALNFIDRVVLARFVGPGGGRPLLAGGQVQPGRDRARARVQPRLAAARLLDPRRRGGAAHLRRDRHLLPAARRSRSCSRCRSRRAGWCARWRRPSSSTSYKAVPLVVDRSGAVRALPGAGRSSVGRAGRTEFNFPVTGDGRWRSTSG